MKKVDCNKCAYRRDCISSACSQCSNENRISLIIKLKRDDGSPHRKDPRESKFDPYYIKECSGYRIKE